MLYFGLIIGLIIPVLLGNIILCFIDRERRMRPLENLSLSFLIGEGALTILLFWSFFLNLPSRVYILAAIIFMLFVFKFMILKEYTYLKNIYLYLRGVFPLRPRKFNLRTLFLVLLLIAIFIKLSYAFVETCSKPEYSWDAAGHWTNPGKELFYANRMPDNKYMKIVLLTHYYPKQLSIMHYWLFSWMGEANDQWSKIFFPLGLVCFLILFYGALSRIRGSTGALFFTYLLFSAPLFLYLATIGYADFTICVYFSLGIIFFYQWLREKQDVYFWLFSIFISLTTWIKIEGRLFYILGFIILLFYLWRHYHQPVKSALLKISQYFMCFVIIGLPWQLFVILNKIPTREKFAFNLKYIFALHSQIYTKMFLQGSWGIAWLLIVAAALFYYRTLIKRENIYFVITFLLFYGMCLFIYLFTYDGYVSFEVSFNRVWLSIYPVTVFALGCVVPRLKFKLLGEI